MNAPRLEQAVLAGLLRENNNFLHVKRYNLTEETFTAPETKQIFKVICSEIEEGRTADLLTVSTRLPDLTPEIAELELAISTAVNFPDWCQKLKTVEAARMLKRGANRIGQMPDGSFEEVGRIADFMAGEAERARLTAGGKRIPDITEAADEVEERIFTRPEPPIPLFPPDVEAYRKAYARRGEIFVIGAKTGTGKTAFCASAVWDQLQAGLRILYFCTESSTADILTRIAAAASDVPHYDVRKTAEGERKFREALGELRSRFAPQLRIVGNDAGGISPGKMRQYMRTFPPDVVYVDYLQDLEPDSERRSRKEEVDSMIRKIKALLTEYNAAGIIVSQFNRDSQKAPDTAPDLTWLLDTSTLEQLASTVAFLWTYEKTKETYFYTRKNRNGPPFKYQLHWHEARYVSSVIPFSEVQKGGPR